MNPDFSKTANGLLPAIVQDSFTGTVLMLGYMNEEAWNKTMEEKKVTFFSRSKQRLWTKGEISGNVLIAVELRTDCDRDTILIKATPSGPVCHTGADTCFQERNDSFSLAKLEQIITDRKNNPTASSYTSSLFREGMKRSAQKVGEEAVELALEAAGNDTIRFLEESADLVFHLLVLLQQKNCRFADVLNVLKQRNLQ